MLQLFLCQHGCLASQHYIFYGNEKTLLNKLRYKKLTEVSLTKEDKRKIT